MSRTVDGLTTGFFLLFLILPGALLLSGGTRSNGTSENRALATFPTLGQQTARGASPKSQFEPHAFLSQHLATFSASGRRSGAGASLTSQFETWYGDHFGLRRQLIRWNNAVRVLVLGASPDVAANKGEQSGSAPDPLARRFTKGEDSWFYTFDHDMMADYRGLRTYSQEELARWQATYERRQSWLARRGIAYLLVLVPDKHMVYPEHLPWNVRRARETTRARQVAAHLAAHSNVNVVDLLPALLAAKPEERLYNRTGTHWNDYGAHVAYREILAALGLSSLPLEAFTIERRVGPARPFLNLLEIRDLVSEEYITLSPKASRVARQAEAAAAGERWLRGIPGSEIVMATGDPTLPTALVFHDSFTAINLEPFLSEHFERVHYRWSYHFDPKLVESERPDIVIEERTGRAFLLSNP